MTDEARETTRRELLARGAAWGAGVGVAGHAIAWAASLSPRVLYEPSKRRTLPAPEHFPEGVTFLADLRLFVVREGTVLRALSAVCTHLGCTVAREKEGYHCPCHGSRFTDGGKNVAGPAPRPLPWHPLKRDARGGLVVDLGVDVGPEVSLEVPPLENPR